MIARFIKIYHSLLLPPAAIVGIVGENGAGKTTLFRMMTANIQPDNRLTVTLGESVKVAYVGQIRDTSS